MTQGRWPTKYTPEFLEGAWDYVENYEKYKHPFPSVVGLCDVLKVGKTFIYKWAAQEEELQHIVDAINVKQELININKGVTGDFNSAIVKLLLGKHGYHDKTETEHSGKMEIRAVEYTIVDPHEAKD